MRALVRPWTFALLAAVLLPLLAVPTAAQAAGSFTAAIVSMDPALPEPGDAITLQLQLANSTTSDITNIRAQFMVSTSPLRGRSEIPDLVVGTTLPTYRLVPEAAASGIRLPSGASATITLRTSPRALRMLEADPGAYLLGLEVSGSMRSGEVLTERPVTLLPWMPSLGEGHLGVSTFWTLSAPPSRAADGSFLNASLAESVLPGGRLRVQLDAMRTVRNATWLVDPLLVESLQALQGGARIRESSGDVRAATDAEMRAAATWLDDLKTAVATGTLAALPIGDFDVRAALLAGRVSLARHALTGAAERVGAVMSATAVPLIVPIYGGSIPGSAWRLLHELGADVVLAPDNGYRATQTAYTPTTAMSMPSFPRTALVTDLVTSRTPVTPQVSAAQARQAFAAQLLMTYLERPNDYRAVSVAIPPGWTPEGDVTCANVLNAPWIRQLGPREAAAVGTATREVGRTTANTRQRTQSARATRGVIEQRQLRLLTTDATFSTTIADLVSSVLSQWWVGRLDGRAYASEITTELVDLGDSVRVVTRGDIVFGGEKGAVPVTIANDLPVAVDVLLEAVGIPSARVRTKESTPLHLNAGKRVSVELPTQVTGSGDAYLMLQVLTSARTDIGLPALLTVRSAAYARVAGYVVAVAFAALLLLIALNTMRRMRLRRLGLDEDE